MTKPSKDQIEAEFAKAISKECRDAILQLRDTLKPAFDAKDMGYENSDHARLEITRMVDKRITRLSAEHLKKVGK